MQKMNSRASLSKNGKCLSACSQVQPSFPLRQLTVLQKQTGAASMTLLLPLYKCRACSCDFLCMKGAHGGRAFPCSSSSLHLGQDSFEGRLHSGSYDSLTEIRSKHLGAVFVHARELQLCITADVLWQFCNQHSALLCQRHRFDLLLSELAGDGSAAQAVCKTPDGQGKGMFFHCSAVALTANDDAILCSYAFHLRISKCFTNIK